MRIEQLEYLISVYETGSFSLSAKKKYITQPTISQSINNLETELNVKIFNRTRQGVTLTADGEIVIKKAFDILYIYNELIEELNLRSSSVTGTIKIAAVPSIYSSILPITLESYKQKYPLVNIEIFEKGSYEIVNDVLMSNADIGIIGIPKEQWANNNLHFEKLLSTKVKVFVGGKLGLHNKTELTPEEIIRYPIVIFKSDYKSSQIGENMLQTFLSFLSNYGELNILYSSGNTDMIKKTIAEGSAIGFFTELTLENDPYIFNKSIIALDIKDFNIQSTIAYIQSKNKYSSLAATEFIKELKIQASLFQ